MPLFYGICTQFGFLSFSFLSLLFWFLRVHCCRMPVVIRSETTFLLTVVVVAWMFVRSVHLFVRSLLSCNISDLFRLKCIPTKCIAYLVRELKLGARQLHSPVQSSICYVFGCAFFLFFIFFIFVIHICEIVCVCVWIRSRTSTTYIYDSVISICCRPNARTTTISTFSVYNKYIIYIYIYVCIT